MKNKRNIIIVFCIIIFAIVGICIFLHMKDANVLVEKVIYKYPYETSVRILKNGDVEKSKIIDELTKNGAPTHKYEKVRKLTKSEKEELDAILTNMNNQELKKENFSKSYGLVIKLDGEKLLYSAEYFEQSDIDNLNNFMLKIMDE